ncbi:SIS domain protein [Hyphomonas neptunium ATCC 15444]|uniref:SIS domain protein n=1 Tax=Hyphomonas neptunium (strain ATCC 15444) TaxID=228405 RepID=Q0C066_HYPNA|nr:MULTISPECIES: MurR/RpiR family transcriptional regulator [Hyphomonas]ABI76544.1 SIS domain protein [Hyphomonas neptunium ATCC 15444]
MPASNADELRLQIKREYEGFSKQLRIVAQYILDHPNEIGLETVTVVAERMGVQPSTVVRLAKVLGFDGASQLQKLFKDEVVNSAGALGYKERIRRYKAPASNAKSNHVSSVLDEALECGILGLEDLRHSMNASEIATAVKLIQTASTIYVAGFQRSFPVAAYLSYALQRLRKNTIFIDGTGGLYEHQISFANKDDLLIAIGFNPYSDQIVATLDQAKRNKLKIVGISDSHVSPVVSGAHAPFIVHDPVVRGFRTLTSSMTLAQAIVLAYAFSDTKA